MISFRHQISILQPFEESIAEWIQCQVRTHWDHQSSFYNHFGSYRYRPCAYININKGLKTRGRWKWFGSCCVRPSNRFNWSLEYRIIVIKASKTYPTTEIVGHNQNKMSKQSHKQLWKGNWNLKIWICALMFSCCTPVQCPPTMITTSNVSHR